MVTDYPAAAALRRRHQAAYALPPVGGGGGGGGGGRREEAGRIDEDAAAEAAEALAAAATANAAAAATATAVVGWRERQTQRRRQEREEELARLRDRLRRLEQFGGEEEEEEEEEGEGMASVGERGNWDVTADAEAAEGGRMRGLGEEEEEDRTVDESDAATTVAAEHARTREAAAAAAPTERRHRQQTPTTPSPAPVPLTQARARPQERGGARTGAQGGWRAMSASQLYALASAFVALLAVITSPSSSPGDVGLGSGSGSGSKTGGGVVFVEFGSGGKLSLLSSPSSSNAAATASRNSRRGNDPLTVERVAAMAAAASSSSSKRSDHDSNPSSEEDGHGRYGRRGDEGGSTDLLKHVRELLQVSSSSPSLSSSSSSSDSPKGVDSDRSVHNEKETTAASSAPPSTEEEPQNLNQNQHQKGVFHQRTHHHHHHPGRDSPASDGKGEDSVDVRHEAKGDRRNPAAVAFAEGVLTRDANRHPAALYLPPLLKWMIGLWNPVRLDVAPENGSGWSSGKKYDRGEGKEGGSGEREGGRGWIHRAPSFLFRIIDRSILPSFTSPVTGADFFTSSERGGGGGGGGGNGSSPATDVIDKVLTSTPRLLAVANLLLAVTYLLHSAVADLFLGGASSGAVGTGAAELSRGGAAANFAAAGVGGGISPQAAAAAAGRERLGGYLLFKLLLISAVVEPDALDLLILLSWYSALGFLRSLASLAGGASTRAVRSGRTPPPGAIRLLALVLLCDIVAAACCAALFHGAGWGMVCLLACDCALLGADVLRHAAGCAGGMLEDAHGRTMEMLEGMRMEALTRAQQQEEERARGAGDGAGAGGADGDPALLETVADVHDESGASVADAVGRGLERADAEPVEGGDGGVGVGVGVGVGGGGEDDEDSGFDPELESRRIDRELELLESRHVRRLAMLDEASFALDMAAHALTVLHFAHIWTLHGFGFGLVGGVLALHLHSAFAAVGRKVADRRSRRRLARDLDGCFEDATELELRKAAAAGDVCCICLGAMAVSGGPHHAAHAQGRNVKKVRCGHLYHAHCLREVVERARSLEAARCPLCRASVVEGHQPPPPGEGGAGPAEAQGGTAPNNGGAGAAEGGDDQVPQQQQQQQDAPPQLQLQQAPMLNGNGNNNEERALFRFSTDGILPAWVPLPAFSFEVVRRPVNTGNGGNGAAGPNAAPLNDTLRAGWIVPGTIGGGGGRQQPQPPPPPAALAQQAVTPFGNAGGAGGETPFWRRLLVVAGLLPMSPVEEAAALEQLVDMFPQYDRADLRSELRRLGSAEAVVEAVLAGLFAGLPRGGGGDDAAGAAFGGLGDDLGGAAGMMQDRQGEEDDESYGVGGDAHRQGEAFIPDPIVDDDNNSILDTGTDLGAHPQEQDDGQIVHEGARQ